LINELIYKKNFEENATLDKLSLSDYFSSAALFVIKEADGPYLLKNLEFGRQDAKSESEAGDTKLIPSASNYRENLKAKGFEDDEIVALASVEAFGKVWDPKQKDNSN
jgi:hypothetical protein